MVERLLLSFDETWGQAMKTAQLNGPVLFFLVFLSACVSADVQREVGLIGEATEAVSNRAMTRLAPQVQAFEEAEPERAAEDGDVWLLSVECDTNSEIFNYDSLDACKVEKLANGGAGKRAPTLLQSVERKLSGLVQYSTLLSELAAAGTEDEIQLAFGNLTNALDDLGDETSSGGLTRIADLFDDSSDKVDAVVDAGVSALRARMLKRTVTDAHPLVVSLTGELKAQLLALNFDPGYISARDDMRQANDAALASVSSGDVAQTAAAYRTLEARHAAFIRVAERSIYIQLDQLAAAHDGLRARLGQRPSRDALSEYVRALKDLKKTLES